MCLIVELMALLSGIYALVTGKFRLTDRFYLQEKRARLE